MQILAIQVRTSRFKEGCASVYQREVPF